MVIAAVRPRNDALCRLADQFTDGLPWSVPWRPSSRNPVTLYRAQPPIRHCDNSFFKGHLAQAQPPERSLLALSTSSQLLVVGTRGRGGFVATVFGSTSQSLLLSVQTPIMIAPTP